jgi:hypothetical protein
MAASAAAQQRERVTKVTWPFSSEEGSTSKKRFVP